MGKTVDQLRANLVTRDDVNQSIGDFLHAEAKTARTFIEIARTQLALGSAERIGELAAKARTAHGEMLRWIGKAQERGVATCDFETEASQIFDALATLEDERGRGDG